MAEFTAANPPAKQRTFLGHPIGLYILFFTEMWERFSYYGMRALLMLYMVNYFKWSQKDASSIYKWYTSLVYLTPLLGGYLADRYLGNKRAVVIGALLMAVGHFLMAFEPLPAFSAALVFLILGNGFFKPNMSTQVGRLYPQNDPRRDGAYTIFYMGINLGAFMSPLICGWLAENTLGGYHSGFTIAGVGMVCGLLIYVFGIRWIVEIDHASPAVGDTTDPVDSQKASEAITSQPAPGPHAITRPEDVGSDQTSVTAGSNLTGLAAPVGPISEEVAEKTPSRMPLLNRIAPKLMAGLGIVLAFGAPVAALVGMIAKNTAISLEIAAVCALISAWITSQVHQAVRDRVLAIYILGIFVVFFWAAFEQAGNAMNLWADKITDRYLTTPMPAVPLYDEVKESDEPPAAGEATAPSARATGLARWTTMFKPIPHAHSDSDQTWGQWWTALWNPVPTAWFQSINALAIFVLAPIFAALWTFLDRRGVNPSVPTKMGFGVLLMALSFALMIGAAKREDQPSSTKLVGDKLPPPIAVNKENQLSPAATPEDPHPEAYHAGRLVFDPATKTINMRGVLPDLERDRIVRDTAPPDFAAKVKELQKKSQDAEKEPFEVKVKLEREPAGFDLRYSGFSKKEVSYDPETKTLNSTIRLADKDGKAILVGAGDPQFRDTLNDLMVKSGAFRVSSWWLFWFYILATLGELCLSPVGLSMVSKLAPAKFATMLMGLWLLTSFFGNFVAGAFGEIWGTVEPTPYFWIFVAALGGASLVLFVMVRKIVSIMHGVN